MYENFERQTVSIDLISSYRNKLKGRKVNRTREALAKQIARLTGNKGQSETTKQALRYARGALKSTLASERELKEWAEKLSAL